MLEITINAKQVIAMVWTLFAFAVSLVVVIELGFPNAFGAGWPWWLLFAVFFGVFLVITLPVYLLLALWGIMSSRE